MKFKKKKLQIKCKQILNNNRINKLKKKRKQILKKKQSKKILIFYRNMIVFAII